MNSEKHIKVTGHSNVSWKDAIIQTVNEAAKTLTNLQSIKVLDQSAKIINNKIVEYIVDLEITFEILPAQISSDTED